MTVHLGRREGDPCPVEGGATPSWHLVTCMINDHVITHLGRSEGDPCPVEVGAARCWRLVT